MIQNLVDARAAPGAGRAARHRARGSRRRRWRRCDASRCRRITTSAPPTSTPSGSARCWRWRTSAICATSRRCCCSSSSARARCSRWRSSPRSCTARRRASTDPARFSFAHGGKDGHPFPVPLRIYDESIAVLDRPSTRPDWATPTSSTAWRVSTRSRAGSSGAAIRTPTSTPTIAHERAISPALGGRTVFDDRPAPRRRATSAHGQLSLFPK